MGARNRNMCTSAPKQRLLRSKRTKAKAPPFVCQLPDKHPRPYTGRTPSIVCRSDRAAEGACQPGWRWNRRQAQLAGALGAKQTKTASALFRQHRNGPNLIAAAVPGTAPLKFFSPNNRQYRRAFHTPAPNEPLFRCHLRCNRARRHRMAYES